MKEHGDGSFERPYRTPQGMAKGIARDRGPTIYYVFRPRSLIDEAILAEWKAIYEHMRSLPNPKHVTLWCELPMGIWDMGDAVRIVPWSSGEVVP